MFANLLWNPENPAPAKCLRVNTQWKPKLILIQNEFPIHNSTSNNLTFLIFFPTILVLRRTSHSGQFHYFINGSHFNISPPKSSTTNRLMLNSDKFANSPTCAADSRADESKPLFFVRHGTYSMSHVMLYRAFFAFSNKHLIRFNELHSRNSFNMLGRMHAFQ